MTQENLKTIIDAAIGTVLQADAARRDAVRREVVADASIRIITAFNLVRGLCSPLRLNQADSTNPAA